MYLHEIKSIKPLNDELYEISSLPVGIIPNCSNQSTFIEKNKKIFMDNLATHHGKSQMMDLVGFKFYSAIKPFDNAIETLLFARHIDTTDPNAVLTEMLIPALIDGTNPDFRGLKYEVSDKYVDYEIASGNVIPIKPGYELDGKGWIKKVNSVLIGTGCRLEPDPEPKVMVKGQAFYFVATYLNGKRKQYNFSPSKNIIYAHQN